MESRKTLDFSYTNNDIFDLYNECKDILKRYDTKISDFIGTYYSQASGNNTGLYREDLQALYDVGGGTFDRRGRNDYKGRRTTTEAKTLDFSYTDNDILQKKRELSVDLAKKIYNRISKDIDFDLQNKEHRKLLRPTEDDRDFVFNADLSMLDNDVDFVLDRAEAIYTKKLPHYRESFFLKNFQLT